MTRTVRHLPAYPDPVQRINTPRAGAVAEQAPVESVAPAQIAALSTRVAWLETKANAAREAHLEARVVAETVCAESMGEMADRTVTLLDAFRSDVRREREEAIEARYRAMVEWKSALEAEAATLREMVLVLRADRDSDRAELRACMESMRGLANSLVDDRATTVETRNLAAQALMRVTELADTVQTPTLPPPITPLEWITIVLTFGLWRPKSRR